jgi:hypothetical protein
METPWIEYAISSVSEEPAKKARAELASLRAELEAVHIVNHGLLANDEKLRAEIDRYDSICTAVRNELTAAGIPELTDDRLTVVPLVKRVATLRADNSRLTALAYFDTDAGPMSERERADGLEAMVDRMAETITAEKAQHIADVEALKAAHYQLKSDNSRLQAENERLRGVEDAAKKLLTRMFAVYLDSAYKSVWAMAQNLMGPYAGPTWIDAENDLRAALSAPQEKP